MRPGYQRTEVTQAPVPYGDGGYYRAVTGALSIPAGLTPNSEVLQFRNGTSGVSAVLLSLRVVGMFATTAFVEGAIVFSLYRNGSWTVDGSGGTTPTVGTYTKMRSGMRNVTCTYRYSSGSALTAGTKTMETIPIARILANSAEDHVAGVLGTGQIHLPDNGWLIRPPGPWEHPPVFEYQEGFSLTTSVPGTGVWTAAYEIVWAETPYVPR